MPSAVDGIISKLEESGYEAYAEGGCIRDSVMGKVPSDWDICTSSLPEETLECLGAENIVKNGLKHGFLRKSVGDIAVLSFFCKS